MFILTFLFTVSTVDFNKRCVLFLLHQVNRIYVPFKSYIIRHLLNLIEFSYAHHADTHLTDVFDSSLI